MARIVTNGDVSVSGTLGNMEVLRSERFRVERELGAGGMGVVYRARDLERDQPVALKTFQALSGQAIYRLKQEFRVLADVRHDNLVRLEELHADDDQWFFTMELLDGVSFRSHVRSSDEEDDSAVVPSMTATAGDTAAAANTPVGRNLTGMVDEERLRDALQQLVTGVAHLHRQGIVHCDIKPSNVIVTGHGRVVLLDFGLSRVWADDDSSGKIEGTVAYMSPEQARGDQPSPASDMYAVGVMLYESLAGRLPFTGTAVQVLAEKQRGSASPPSAHTAGVPDDLDTLCAALLQHDPAKRPSSAQVLELMDAPATSGVYEEHFVGRKAQLAWLHERSNPQGFCQALIIGEAGSGKTALARRFAADLQENSTTVVLRSRCHEQEAVPLKALDGIVDDLSHWLMTRPESDAVRLIPPEIAPLVRVFPVLERVPAVRALHLGRESAGTIEQLRLYASVALRRMLTAISEQYGLLLLIDDLQWVDDASLEFLRVVLPERDTVPNAMLLATARPTLGERDFADLLPVFDELELAGLTDEAALALLEVSYGAEVMRETAAELIAETKGHPLLIEELARYRATGGTETDITVQGALAHRIERLGETERAVLEAVCVGGTALTLEMLREALGLSRANCDAAAQQLRVDKLVRRDSRARTRWLEPYHDRVRETIEQSLEGSNRRSGLHLSLGRALLARQASIFAIVGNLNRVRDEFADNERLAALNLQAAEGAFRATAHQQALTYALVGLEMTSDDAERFKLGVIQMECEFTVGRRDVARKLFDELKLIAAGPTQIARVYCAKMDLETTADNDDIGMSHLFEALARLDWKLPARVGKLRLVSAMVGALLAIRKLRPSDVVNLPDNEDEHFACVSDVIQSGIVSLYRISPVHQQILLSRSLRSIARHGAVRGSSGTLTSLAVGMCGLFSKLRYGHELAKAALKLAERRGDPLTPVKAVYAQFISHWVKPHDQMDAITADAYEVAAREGFYLFLSTLRIGPVYARGVFCRDTHDLHQIATTLRDDSTRIGWMDNVHVANCELQWLASITGEVDGDLMEAFDAVAAPITAKMAMASALLPYTRARLHYHFGDRAAAWGCMVEADEHKNMHLSSSLGISAVFYKALAARAAYAQTSWWRRRRMRSSMRYARKRFRQWAKVCPDNFEPMSVVLEAELSRLGRSQKRIRERFDNAIKVCTGHRSWRLLAMTHELYAEALGDDPTAAVHIEQARTAWDKYGAPALAQRLSPQMRRLSS